MKLLVTSIVLVLSFNLVEGMGCKGKDTPASSPKVLPESTKASAPPASVLETAPIKLIENTAEENKKVDEKLSEAPAKVEATTPPPKKMSKQKAKRKTKAQKKVAVQAKKAKKKS